MQPPWIFNDWSVSLQCEHGQESLHPPKLWIRICLHSNLTESSCCTLASISTSKLLLVDFFSSSHPVVNLLVQCFIYVVAMQSQLQMGKWLTSFLHTEKMAHCVIIGGDSGVSPFRALHSLLPSFWTCSPSTRALSWSPFGSLASQSKFCQMFFHLISGC